MWEVWAIPETPSALCVAIPPPSPSAPALSRAVRKVENVRFARPWALEHATDITHLGGWKQYLSRRLTYAHVTNDKYKEVRVSRSLVQLSES